MYNCQSYAQIYMAVIQLPCSSQICKRVTSKTMNLLRNMANYIDQTLLWKSGDIAPCYMELIKYFFTTVLINLAWTFIGLEWKYLLVWNFIQVEMSFVGKPCVVKHIFNILSKLKNSACTITFTKCMMHASE